MYQLIKKNRKMISGIAACLVICGISMSFQNTPFGPLDKLETLTDVQDTIPENNKESEEQMSIKDFDELLQNMDKEGLKTREEITKIDFHKMHSEITASLNKVDFDKIKIDIDKVMKEIDFSTIEHGIESALNEIDWNKMNNDLKISLQNAKKEIEKINMEQIKRDMEKAKLEIEISKKEIKKINVNEIMKKVNEGIAKAKNELHLTKEMFIQMENDGLINQKNGFTIEYKGKTLIINGKKQGESITNKYRPYITADTFKITISKG